MWKLCILNDWTKMLQVWGRTCCSLQENLAVSSSVRNLGYETWCIWSWWHISCGWEEQCRMLWNNFIFHFSCFEDGTFWHLLVVVNKFNIWIQHFSNFCVWTSTSLFFNELQNIDYCGEEKNKLWLVTKRGWSMTPVLAYSYCWCK